MTALSQQATRRLVPTIYLSRRVFWDQRYQRRDMSRLGKVVIPQARDTPKERLRYRIAGAMSWSWIQFV